MVSADDTVPLGKPSAANAAAAVLTQRVVASGFLRDASQALLRISQGRYLIQKNKTKWPCAPKRRRSKAMCSMLLVGEKAPTKRRFCMQTFALRRRDFFRIDVAWPLRFAQ